MELFHGSGFGGGTPPYTLQPQTPDEAAKATATLVGNLVELVAPAGSPGGALFVTALDSSVPPKSSRAVVSVAAAEFTPTVFTEFHTTLEGSAPGCTIRVFQPGGLPVESVDIFLQGLSLRVGDIIAAGTIPATVEVAPNFGDVVYAHMEVIATEPGQARFEVVSLEEGREVLATGVFNESPPLLRIHTLYGTPGRPLPVGLEWNGRSSLPMAFSNFRPVSPRRFPWPRRSPPFPATPGAMLRCVGRRTRSSAPAARTARGSRACFPRTRRPLGFVECFIFTARVFPAHAQATAYVRLEGSAMGADSVVTFSYQSGLRVPAAVERRTPSSLTVVVPEDAEAAGPIQVT
ncbi:MAG: hypothetical protein O3C21_21070, partial [Verrucomicrobia bacterium]|nr:hypothetical protein [Verrucomicrobiota bacterium]